MITDEEFVKRMRSNLWKLDRWRKWLVMLHIGILLGVVGLLISFSNMIRQPNGLFQGAGIGLLIGITMGSSIGLMLVHNVTALVNLMPMAKRSERFMLRYHDELAALKGEPGARGRGCSFTAESESDGSQMSK